MKKACAESILVQIWEQTTVITTNSNRQLQTGHKTGMPAKQTNTRHTYTITHPDTGTSCFRTLLVQTIVVVEVDQTISNVP